jgi:hypothetical protein
MRRVLFLLGMAATALLGGPGSSSAQAPAGDSVIASVSTAVDPDFAAGRLGCCSYAFSIDAHSGALGEAPGGQVHVAFGGRGVDPYDFAGHVTCLAVNGNQAVIGVVVDENPHPAGPTVGQEVTLFAADNRGPTTPTGTVHPDADRFGLVLNRPGCPAFPVPPESEELYYVYAGDIAIHDAEPLPTSKDQCKNGGWQTFGIFKNQGDCVSFVATGGENPPGG